MRRPLRALVTAVLAICAVALAGCTAETPELPKPNPESASLFTTIEPSPTTSAAPSPAPPPEVTDDAFRDIDYVGDGNRKQTLDLYLPTSPEHPDPAPLVIFVHGGGWNQGDKSAFDERAGGKMVAIVDFLRANGYAVAGVNYRLSDEATWPAPLHDLKAATRHLRAYAGAYGIDPARFAVAGESAGGQLAMMLGLTPNVADLDGPEGPRDVSTEFSAIVSYYGVSDLRTLPAERHEHNCPPQSMPGATTLEGRMLGVEPSQSEGALLGSQASPIMYASAAAPPLMLLHGTSDCTVVDVQSIRMHQAMQASGGHSELLLNSANHAAAVFFSDPKLQTELLRFLDDAMGG